MGPIILAGFTGANLAIGARLLPESVGVSATDATPVAGDLRPLRTPLTVATGTAGRKTIYRIGRDSASESNFWLSWPSPVSVMRGFDANDTSERTYYSGAGTPKWTDNLMGLGSAPYPTAYRELAVPTPTIVPSLAQTTAGSGTAGITYYVYTFVNDIGWESAPSGPAYITIAPGAVVDISNFDTAPSGAYGVNRIRIYRTSVGVTGSAEFLFLREISVGTTTTQDDARGLGDILPTVGWMPPPAAGFGLIGLWGSMAAICSGKAVHFCEPGLLYAFPAKYDIALMDTPVATATFEQNLIVLTTGRPVMIQGTDPAGLVDTRLTLSHPCVAARSVVSFGHGVVWASKEGLAYVGSNGQRLLTEGVVLQRQWKTLNPSTMTAARWGRMYVCFYTDGASVRRGFMMDPLRPQDGIWFLTTGYDTCFYDELLDELYVLDGADIKRFDGSGTFLWAKFTSKVFRQTAPRNFPFAEVTADGYPLIFKIYADGALKFTKTVPNAQPFTLPSGFMAEDWQVEIASPYPVQVVRMGSIAQLRDGGS